MENLERNVAKNNVNKNLRARTLGWGEGIITKTHKEGRGHNSTELTAAELTQKKKSAKQFDYIIATDVIFAADLVIPLLKTIHQHSHGDTVFYLCAQVREPSAHEKFFEEIGGYFGKVEKLSLRNSSSEGGDPTGFPGSGYSLEVLGAHAEELECYLFEVSEKKAFNGIQ